MQTNSGRYTATKAVAFSLNQERVNKLMKAHGIPTESELARRVGINVATLYRVRNGITPPSNEVMAKFRLAFPSVSHDDLFPIVELQSQVA